MVSLFNGVLFIGFALSRKSLRADTAISCSLSSSPASRPSRQSADSSGRRRSIHPGPSRLAARFALPPLANRSPPQSTQNRRLPASLGCPSGVPACASLPSLSHATGTLETACALPSPPPSVKCEG